MDGVVDAAEVGVWFNANDDVEIARRAATGAALALTRQANLGAIVHASRYFYG